MVLLAASYVQGITGFGQGLVAAPLAFILFPKYFAISALIVAGIVINGYLTLTVKGKLNYRSLGLLLVGGLLGLPLGLFMVEATSLSLLQITVGALSILLSLALVLIRTQVKARPLLSVSAGVVSGALQSSTTLSGPPVVFLLSVQHLPKQAARKLLPVYFLGMGILGAILFLSQSLISTQGILIGIIASPLVVVGGRLGSNHSRKIDQNHYQLIDLILIGLAGGVAITEGLSNWIK